MNIKNVNDFFGNALLVLGGSRLVIMFLTLLNLINILSTGYSNNSDLYITIANIINVLEVIIIIGCVVMLIINNKQQTGVTKGYTYALLAVLTELLTVIPIINILIGIVVCMQYIKAGNKIKSDNFIYYPQNKKVNKEMLTKSDWFYSDESNNKIEKELSKCIKKKEKIDEEISAWKSLVNTGEITEEIYFQETKQLVEKSENLEEQINRYNLMNKNKIV